MIKIFLFYSSKPQNARWRDRCCTFTQGISVSQIVIIVIKVQHTFLSGVLCFFWNETGESLVFFRSIGESESENMHLARLWREGSPERQLVALSAELRRSGLLLKNTIDSPSPPKELQKSILSGMDIIYIRFGKYKYYRKIF